MNTNKTEKRVSCLICFAGKNNRVEINPKKCVFKGREFTYKTLYKTSDGGKFPIEMQSRLGSDGSAVDVKIYSAKGSVIAERENIPVRFFKYLYM